MDKQDLAELLIMIEVISGTIPQKSKRTLANPIKRNLNKKCHNCGHKNKKCTCKLESKG